MNKYSVCNDQAPHGMIPATGPTGSGKTITLYSAIESLNIEKKASEHEIRKAATAQGMISLFEDGFSKVVNGVTTLEEIMRVTT